MSRLRIRRKRQEDPEDLQIQLAALKAKYDKLKLKHKKGIEYYQRLIEKLKELNYIQVDENRNEIRFVGTPVRETSEEMEELVQQATERVVEMATAPTQRTLDSYSLIELYDEVSTPFVLKVVFNYVMKHLGWFFFLGFTAVYLGWKYL